MSGVYTLRGKEDTNSAIEPISDSVVGTWVSYAPMLIPGYTTLGVVCMDGNAALNIPAVNLELASITSDFPAVTSQHHDSNLIPAWIERLLRVVYSSSQSAGKR